MFDIGFTELIVVGVVALIVIGPERLPKVARTAGHLYGRMQRYVSSVRSDISQEIQFDELRRAGQEFKQSVESSVTSVQDQATVVDDYLRDEAAGLRDSVRHLGDALDAPDTPARGEPAHDEPSSRASDRRRSEVEAAAQQSLPLDEPEQGSPTPPDAVPAAVVESARPDSTGKAG